MVLFVCLSAISVVAAGPSLQVGAGPTSRPYPNCLVYASKGEPDSLDPAFDYENNGQEVLQNVYETLVTFSRDDPTVLQPLLCTEVPTVENRRVLNGGTEYIYTIKSGVKFHSGNMLTAEDVEFSLERVLSMNSVYSPAWMLGEYLIPNYYDYSGVGDGAPPQYLIDNSVISSGNNVLIFLARPCPFFNNIMTTTVTSVVEKAFVLNHGGVVRGEAYNDFLNTHECGTGPFELIEWASGSHWLLQRFDDYHGEPASLSYVLCETVPSFDVRAMMLSAGDADSIDVPYTNQSQVEAMPGVKAIKGANTYIMECAGFNQNIQSGGRDHGDVPADFFSDQNIRKAFTMALDPDLLEGTSLSGGMVQSNSPIPQGMFGYDGSVPYNALNLSGVAELLGAALDPRTNQSYADEGFRIVLYYNDGNIFREEVCESLKANLESLTFLALVPGTIVVDVVGLDTGSFYSEEFNGATLLVFVGWLSERGDPDDFTTLFLSNSGSYPHLMGIQDPVLSGMVDSARTEMDKNARASGYSAISYWAYNMSYYLCQYQYLGFQAFRSIVQGYQFGPMDYGLRFQYLSFDTSGLTAPMDVVAVAGEGSAILTWTAPPAVNGTSVVGYKLWYGTSSGPLTPSVTTTNSSVVNGLQKGQTYQFVVSAMFDIGLGPNSSVATAVPFGPPDAPTGLSATPGPRQVSMGWSAPSYTGPGDLTYHLFRNGSLIWNGTGTSFTDLPLVAGVSYTYKVAASNADGWGPNCTAVDVTTASPVLPPEAPSGMTPTAGDGQVILAWTAPADGGEPIDYYVVYQDGVDVAHATNTSYTVMGLTNGQEYHFKVAAHNSAGLGTNSTEMMVSPKAQTSAGGMDMTLVLAIVAIAAIVMVAALIMMRKKKG